MKANFIVVVNSPDSDGTVLIFSSFPTFEYVHHYLKLADNDFCTNITESARKPLKRHMPKITAVLLLIGENGQVMGVVLVGAVFLVNKHAHYSIKFLVLMTCTRWYNRARMFES